MKAPFVTLMIALATVAFSAMARAGDEPETTYLRQQVEDLKQENQSLKERLKQLQTQMSQSRRSEASVGGEASGTQAPAPANVPPPVAVPAVRPTPVAGADELPPWQFGVRPGWAGSPWRGGTGGFFYGAYADRQLSNSLLGGNLDMEFMFGSVFGANAAESNTGGGRGSGAGRGEVPWQNSYLFQPTFQYYPHFRSLLDWWPTSLWPYLLAGPEAVLGRLGQPGRGIATDAEAGGVFGAGLKMFPFWAGEGESNGFLQRLAWGAEWRFNQGTNGQSFNQYMATLSFGF
jgi:hypothetical protein